MTLVKFVIINKDNQQCKMRTLRNLKNNYKAYNVEYYFKGQVLYVGIRIIIS